MDLHAMLLFAAIAVASPVLGYAGHCLIDRYKIRQAHRFLEAEPLIYEGARFRKLMTREGAQLLGPGRIESLEEGRVLVASSDGAVRIPLDGPEFKDAWAHWLEPEESGLPAPRRGDYS